MCYHVEFGSSATKGLRINRREPPKFGSAGVPPPCARGVDDPHRNTPLTYTCYPAEFGRSMPNGASVIKDIHLKIWPLASRLSRSFKVIGSDADRSATYDFVLTFHSNHGPISYRFRDKRQLRRKVAKFPHTRVFCAPPPTEGVPLGIGYQRRSRSKNYNDGDIGPRRMNEWMNFAMHYLILWEQLTV